MGINGSGIDIRPIGPLNIRYERLPSSSVSPFETLELEFTVADDSEVSLLVGGATTTVSHKRPAQLRFTVTGGATPGRYRVAVELPGAAAPVLPATTGSYDPTSTFVEPYPQQPSGGVRPPSLVVDLLGLVSQIGVQL